MRIYFDSRETGERLLGSKKGTTVFRSAAESSSERAKSVAMKIFTDSQWTREHIINAPS